MAIEQKQQYPQSNTSILLNDSDKALVKNTFANKLDLLLLLRKSLLQGEMSSEEKNTFVNFSKELVAVLRKQFLPTINLENPAAQLVDIWAKVHPRGMSVDQAWLEMEAIKTVIDYLEERFAFLEGKGEGKTKLKDLEYGRNKSKEQAFIDLVARHEIIFQIDSNVGILWAIASQVEEKKEDIEELKKKKSMR